MNEPEKKRRFSSIFKTKDSSSKLSASGGTAISSANPSTVGTVEEEGPRGGRRKLFTQLSEAEKSQRRSTLGSAQLSQATTSPAPSQTSQMAAASPGSKAVLFSRPNQPTAAPELETPFAKMVRTSGNTSSANVAPSTTGSLQKQLSSPDQPAEITSTRRGASLTAEEKKTRRKSLLAPVQNLFSAMSGESGADSSTAPDDSKKKKSIFGGKREKGLDFQTGLQLDDSQAKLQKERQKKLQKELDKIEKEKAKQEKARQTRLLDVLQQTLELGEERAQLPMPAHRRVFALPMRPPLETQ